MIEKTVEWLYSCGDQTHLVVFVLILTYLALVIINAWLNKLDKRGENDDR